MKHTRWRVFFILLMVGVCTPAVAELSHEDIVQQSSTFSSAVSNIVPRGWYIWKTKVGSCQFLRGREGIEIYLRCRAARNMMMSSQAALVFIQSDYHSLTNALFPAPFPLVARTPQYQIFLWGAPSLFGWNSALADIVKALSACEPNIEWNRLSDSELEQLEEVRAHGSKQQFVAEWGKQVQRLERYVVTNTAGDTTLDTGSVKLPESRMLPKSTTMRDLKPCGTNHVDTADHSGSVTP